MSRDQEETPPVVQFAEISGVTRHGRHVGCVMAAGPDWIEVSIPSGVAPAGRLEVHLPPSKYRYVVTVGWYGPDRVGLVYASGSPPREEIAPSLYVNVPASTLIE